MSVAGIDIYDYICKKLEDKKILGWDSNIIYELNKLTEDDINIINNKKKENK